MGPYRVRTERLIAWAAFILAGTVILLFLIP